MTLHTLSTLALLSHCSGLASASRPLAEVSLYNPTSWDGPCFVEVPVGRIASPGILNWKRIHLEQEGRFLPFAIREGCAHWKAEFKAPVQDIRPEDLLVFSCAVPPREWVRVEVVQGKPKRGEALKERAGRLEVTYPGFRAVVDEATGMLVVCEALGEALFSGPLSITPTDLIDPGYEMKGPFAVGYQSASVAMRKATALECKARKISSSSTPSMTEIHFELGCEGGPTMGLTYRIHAMGRLEVLLDERPWEGESPWLRRCVEARLPFRGREDALPRLENRWPFYGFRDYAASVKSVGRLHAVGRVLALELGEETVNGRRYSRQITVFREDLKGAASDLVELADEGLVVAILPAATGPVKPPIFVAGAGGQSEAAPSQLVDQLKRSGVELAATGAGAGTFIRLEKVQDPASLDLEGDGFSILSDLPGQVAIRSGTELGLFNACQAAARSLNRCGPDRGIPLIARNPGVPVRGGGFGGGNFEVDFPYGTEEEWTRVFDALLESGMNVFTCMGMWSNWKMPVGYAHMPELRSDAPDAYDESSGALFSELEMHRERGLRLLRYLQERGARVWLWIPIGCVPTSFARKFPEAMSPGSDKVPCCTHPEYRRYVDAFLREILETYPVDGFVLIRDDNGGICGCDRCKAFVASSRTQSPVWEQVLIITDWLRENGFRGDMAVYPYNDTYEPRLDSLLPKDLIVVGHGGGAAVLSRQFDRIGPMGDTWLDNLYANFRIPPSPRMKRLLSDRPSFWIGGAYCGTELPWEAIGYFGWDPSATPNSLRHDWGLREFGESGALRFLETSRSYEKLWDLNAMAMLPSEWMNLSSDGRREVASEGLEILSQYKAHLQGLKDAVGAETHTRWFSHMELFSPFFEYHLHRLHLFASLYDRVSPFRDALDGPEGLPEDIRQAVLTDYAEMYSWAERYDQAMQKAPDGMLSHCRWMTRPYKEWMAGYDEWLDPLLKIRQFAGTCRVEADPLRHGQPFQLRVELHNQGICPWIPGVGHKLEFSGDAARLGLPATWEFAGDPMAPGDRRLIEFNGTAPTEPGAVNLSLTFLSPFRSASPFIRSNAPLSWQP